MTDDHQEQLRQLHAAKGGYEQRIRDSRVTSIAQWFWNLIGGLMVVALCFVANNLYQINLTLAADAVAKKQMSEDIAELKGDVKEIRGDVRELQGKTFRGVPGYPKESRNGH